MPHLPATRAAHVIGFVELLREIGTPVERELTRSKLPSLIEEIPDAWMCSAFVMDFVGRSARQEGIEDIGWLGVKHFRLSQLDHDLLASLSGASTLLGRLRRFFELMKLEDNSLSGGIIPEGESMRVWFNSIRVPEGEPLEVSEWFQVGILVEIVRSVLGPAWCPEEIAFQSEFPVCDDALQEFGNARFRFGSAATSIVLPRFQLAMSPPAATAQRPDVPVGLRAGPGLEDISIQIRKLISAYWGDAVPTVELAADMAGTSVRTLQRRLVQEGATFSDILQASRFERAQQMLADPKARIVDIAFALGYEDSSNFARAFRRVTGVSPRGFRQAVSDGVIAAE